MAVDGERSYGDRKRKRGSMKRKLLVNERVEVKSFEEGLLGSWHPGKVIRCGRQKRHVRYDNVLDDDGVNYVVEVVRVPNVLDGVSSPSISWKERGLIRPQPPVIEFGERDLSFGLCVDVNYQEAWWEGVIFDHCDEMKERGIFFPDLGDEIKVGIHQLRITQDWDEVTENWKTRGKWVFLELFEECEQVSYVAVSAKQIWYDVRERDDFEYIRDWSCNVKELWRDLVVEVVGDYYTLTLEEIFPSLNLPEDFLKGTPELESSQPIDNNHCDASHSDGFGCDCGISKPKENEEASSFLDIDQNCDTIILIQEKHGNDNAFGSDSGSEKPNEDEGLLNMSDIYQYCDSIIPIQEEYDTDNALCDANHSNVLGSDTAICEIPEENDDTDQNCGIIIPSEEKYGTNPLVDGEPEKDILLSPLEEVLPESKTEIPCYDDGVEEISGSSCSKRRRSESIAWNTLKLSEVEFCPDVINEYRAGCKSKTIREHLKTKVRKHLTYLGWTIEWTTHKHDPELRRYRYKSPDANDQKVYNSITQVVKYMQRKEGSNMNSVPPQTDHNSMHSTIDGNLSHLLSDQPQMNQDLDVYPPTGAASPVKAEVEPEFCPQAVVKYYLHVLENQPADQRKWKLKAKKHLLAEGWIFDYPTENRKTTLYKSLQNQCLGTLRGACRLYLKEKIPEWTASGRLLNVSDTNEVSADHVDDSEDLLQCVSQLLQKEPELHDIDGLQASRSTRNRNNKRTRKSKASQPKCQRVLPTRVLRTSKRVQQMSIPSLSSEKRQNVLSWLIDNNMVLQEYKVFYRANGGRDTPVFEGRITQDGIICNCCQKVYGPAGFVNHAGDSNNSRPSARIFLQDGRSLFDCMIQVMCDHRTREIIEKPCNDICEGENDNVCTICNYGGELLLCDKCPSVFHKECLNLEDIPDGDWFCPSCRCGICGQIKIEGTEDGEFITCVQCEHKYHVGCLRNRPEYQSRRYLKHWFCGKECEQVFAGIHNLLGKPVIVGRNDLTWTLMKWEDTENCEVGSTKNDLLAESYSKLSVALSVMHECFEPLKNPFSNRDLVDDIIFNRRSELNRLNFQGFYTILLERNEEMISVATLRVFGEKVAELPLIGTRVPYRRVGMCRILMDELEKKLIQLGVERLVLPAVPGMLNTWRDSFGFSQMTDLERAQYLDCTFLDFQETIMCQKLLKRVPSPDSALTGETHPEQQHDGFSVQCRVEFDKSTSASEVDQTEEIDKSGMVDLQETQRVNMTTTK